MSTITPSSNMSTKSIKHNRAQLLQARKQILLAQCRLQRLELRWHGAQIQDHLRYIEIGLRTAKALRASPILLAIFAAGITIVKPKRAFFLLKTGLSSWRWWQTLAPVLLPLIRSWRARSAASRTNSSDTKNLNTSQSSSQ
ncbi:YqjK family protein [Undibacterium baiyunense]|uniref:YqjK-like protein n=1 Tax=Undibacterium baiyunense TaxID=2828731 RepID=A0A941DGF6_9BURK|nr:YqjK family protein [Undibacterium baiyunense]MBR7747626.1 hypothetical protein [Undibacterium baiyunense]